MFDHQKIRNRNLQCLRGLAILMVVITHLLYTLESNNFILFMNHTFDFAIGVDLFFIISGYLMGLTFLSKLRQPITIVDAFCFYKKRIKRLFKTNFFWSFFILLFSTVWVIQGALPNVMFSIWLFLSNIVFLGNVFNAFHTNNFGYFWTLGTEVQFYLALPFFVFCFKKHLIFGISAILLILTFFNPIPVNYQWLFRWNSLFIGLLIWKLTTDNSFKDVADDIALWNNQFKIFITVLLFCAMAFIARVVPIEWAIKSTILGIGLGIVMVIFLSSNRIVFGFASRVLEKIGDVSYSWYLCHIPTWVLVSYIFDKVGFAPHNIIRSIIYLSVSIVLATLSYYVIESNSRSKVIIK